MLTLCHLLKVEGIGNISRKIRKSKDYLFAVTISGADQGNTRDMNWDQLIQPLGKGSFDTYTLLEQLWDMGYEGPIGVQFYGIKTDARTILKSTAQEWQNYRIKYIYSHHHEENQSKTIH